MTGVGLTAVMATAAALAADAFSVSVCIGLASPRSKFRNGVILGCVFGGFQFFMPLLGAVIAGALADFLGGLTTWVASGLIVFVALKMILETYKHGNACPSLNVNARNLLALGLATSLDALAVGFSIKSAGGSALLMATAAGAITFAAALFGSMGGGVLGAKLGSAAQYSGAAVLLVIAANIAFG